MKYLKGLIATLIMIAGFSLYSAGQSQAEVTGLLRRYFEIRHKQNGFNGVVLIARDNKVIYHDTIGKASQELDIPMSLHSTFRIASISKQFTAMLIALAVEEGKLRFDDSLDSFFPGIIDPQWPRINVHQLLTHTSGLPHNEGIADYWQRQSLLPLSRQQALAEIFKMKLLFKPGTDVKYSSPGYFLLACILEEVYKKSYAALLDEKIVKPLQLQHTGVYTTNKIVPHLAPGYHLLNDSLIKAPFRDFSLMKGAGDLYATAADLLKWNESFLRAGIWSDDLKKQLFTAHSGKKINQDAYYGYGWFIRPGDKSVRQAYYHGGGSFGCSAISCWYPQEHVSIIILSNVSVLPVNEFWNDVEKIIFGEPFELPEIKDAISINAAHLQKLTGRYTSASVPQELKILLYNNHLYAKLGANPPFEVYASEPLHFFGKKVNVNFTFRQDKDGNISGVAVDGRGQIHYFIKQ